MYKPPQIKCDICKKIPTSKYPLNFGEQVTCLQCRKKKGLFGRGTGQRGYKSYPLALKKHRV